MTRQHLRSANRIRGVTMLEVLVAIFILTIGLLGVAGIQSQMQSAELEAYQRAQAIVLLQDMVDRVNANRKKAADYVTVADLGTATDDCTAYAATEIAKKDMCEWNNALFGAAETKAGGATYGAMNGARGCITNPVAAMPREVVVSVAWQGLRPTFTPSASDCGKDQYGTDDRVRRIMVARVVIGCLQNVAGAATCVTP